MAKQLHFRPEEYGILAYQGRPPTRPVIDVWGVPAMSGVRRLPRTQDGGTPRAKHNGKMGPILSKCCARGVAQAFPRRATSDLLGTRGGWLCLSKHLHYPISLFGGASKMPLAGASFSRREKSRLCHALCVALPGIFSDVPFGTGSSILRFLWSLQALWRQVCGILVLESAAAQLFGILAVVLACAAVSRGFSAFLPQFSAFRRDTRLFGRAPRHFGFFAVFGGFFAVLERRKSRKAVLKQIGPKRVGTSYCDILSHPTLTFCLFLL